MSALPAGTSGFTDGRADGTLVVLLHGFPQDANAWRPVGAALAKTGYRVVAPNLPGHSRETAGSAPTLADAVAMVDEIVGDRTSYHLVGHDLGGIVAWDIACRITDPRLRTVSVFSTPHLRAFAESLSQTDINRKPPFDLFQMEGVAEEMILANDAGGLRLGYQGLPEDTVERDVALFSAPGVLTSALSYFRAFDFDEWRDQPPCTVPALFGYGTEDPYLDPETAGAVAELLAGPSTVAALEGFGHWLPETASDEVLALLKDHLV